MHAMEVKKKNVSPDQRGTVSFNRQIIALQYAAVAALRRGKQNQHLAVDGSFSYVRWDACVKYYFEKVKVKEWSFILSHFTKTS